MNVRFLEHDNYLEVIYTGERAYTKLADLLKFIRRMGEKKALSHLVIDLSQSKGTWADDGQESLDIKISEIFPSVCRILIIDQKGRIPQSSSGQAGSGPRFDMASNRQDGMTWLMKPEP